MATPATGADHTKIERRLYAALDALGVAYLPQHEIGWYRADAFLPDHGIAVEADGCFFHGCPECGYDDWQAVADRRRDARRDRNLGKHRGIRVIHIWGHDLDDDDAALAAVRAALVRAGVLPDDGRARDPPPA